MPESHQQSSHVQILSDTLERLQVTREAAIPLPGPPPGDHHPNSQDAQILSQPGNSTPSTPWNPQTKDGYGFRNSGVSTPLNTAPLPDINTSSPAGDFVPDPNGLGWPGE